MTKQHAIIMAGGAGTRFWPASRRKRPKQCLPLAHDKTLIEATVDRLVPVVGIDHVWIITNSELADELRRALPGLPSSQILIEPEPRDTAPCVALASAWVEARDPGAAMIFVPADHVIEPAAAFAELLHRAAAIAADGTSLVTLGIRPTHPATAYGYIERGPALDDGQPPAFRALRFAEKPDRQTATTFVDSGRFLWNSGVFVWTAHALMEAMAIGNPELAESTRQMLDAAKNGATEDLELAFRNTSATSVDYAVMEKAPRVVVIEATLQWSDLGSFLALESVEAPDADNNVTSLHNGARALFDESSGCIVYGENRHAVALFGVHDLVVVATDDAILVCSKERADDLKALVKKLPDAGMADLL